jgi:AraC-like DNA-binding protein
MQAARARDDATMSCCLILPLVSHLERTGVPVAPVLASVGLEPAGIRAPGARVPHEQAMRLWDRAALASGDPQLGLHVAQHVDAGVMDLVEYLARCSPTLGESLERTSACFGLLHDQVAFRFERSGAHATLRNEVPSWLPVSPIYSENALASTIVMARRMTEREIPVETACFRHAPPEALDAHHEIFGPRVVFRAPVDAIVIPTECLDAPLRQADPALAAILERHVQMVLARPGPLGLRARTARLVEAELEGRTPQAEDVAKRLRMSARTLRRLLHDEGCSFREVVAEVQRELAFRHLCDPGVPIGEVAYRTGFSDPNAFHRAFKRWTGRTPGEFRAETRRDAR